MRFLVLLGLLASLNLSAAKEADSSPEVNNLSNYKSDYQIDWKYQAGNYLIYDCERGHYACVSKDGDENCREERNFAIEKKATSYPCAPLKKFADKKLCVQENYKVVDRNAIKRFCYPK
ncbi:MAG: hypothetical protein ACXVCE_09750 [Bacteriovorax sp.]